MKLFIILIIFMLGCKEYNVNSINDKHITWIEINVCDHPYNAIPGDTLSDSDAFQLAADVAFSLKTNNIFDTINVRIIIPMGEYILDRTLDFNSAQLEVRSNYSIFDIKGSNISISDVNIKYGY